MARMRVSWNSCATSAFRAAIRCSSRPGRIKEGNVADLVVCDGDALADIKRAARKENHLLVVKRGIVAHDNRAAFASQSARVAAE